MSCLEDAYIRHLRTKTINTTNREIFMAGWVARGEVAAEHRKYDEDLKSFRIAVQRFAETVADLREAVDNLKPKVQEVTPIAPAMPEMFKYPEPVRGVCECEFCRPGTRTKD